MNIEQLEKGKQLLQLINTTKAGINQLKELADKRNDEKLNDMYDGQYNFTISEHSDGSGKKANLGRYLGNAKLLDVIIKTLENQLNDYEIQFEEL